MDEARGAIYRTALGAQNCAANGEGRSLSGAGRRATAYARPDTSRQTNVGRCPRTMLVRAVPVGAVREPPAR